ncbi:MAG: shikimate kinase [Actinomycetota bacterium]|jgi:shikimate kinase
MSPKAVLIGIPGAGKSTIGKHLARILEVSFRDTDSDIEKTAGMTISDIFVQLGEPAFRELERDAVAKALEEHDGVLALGGGAVLDPITQEALKNQNVVWLDVSLADAAHRVGLNTSRPLLLGNVRSTLKNLMDQRAPIYREVSTYKVETSGLTPSAVAKQIAKLVSQ